MRIQDRYDDMNRARIELLGAIAAVNVAIVTHGQESPERVEAQKRLISAVNELTTSAVDYGRAMGKNMAEWDGGVGAVIGAMMGGR